MLVGTKVYITCPHAYPPEKVCTKTSIVVLSTSVDLPIWIAYHGDSLILSNSYASISSAVSSVHLVMVLAIKEEHVPPFELQSLLKVHDKCP